MKNLLFNLGLNDKVYGGKKSPRDNQPVTQSYNQKITFNSIEYFTERTSQQQETCVPFSESVAVPCAM